MTDDTKSSGNLISVRLPIFNGVKTDFVIWECKFKARARYYGYASIINGTVAVCTQPEYIRKVFVELLFFFIECTTKGHLFSFPFSIFSPFFL